MKAIVTVLGRDQVGIIADVCTTLAEHDVNILDISQTIMQEYFTMIMLVDTGKSSVAIDELNAVLKSKMEPKNITILVQAETIFNSMHRI
ncbi:MAG: ACT domain-containing protein [Oscillospiraceae bacterium]|nr:ACT domain-containing protein [Oscillospiraceae bacterium]